MLREVGSGDIFLFLNYKTLKTIGQGIFVYDFGRAPEIVIFSYKSAYLFMALVELLK